MGGLYSIRSLIYRCFKDGMRSLIYGCFKDWCWFIDLADYLGKLMFIFTFISKAKYTSIDDSLNLCLINLSCYKLIRDLISSNENDYFPPILSHLFQSTILSRLFQSTI